MAHTGLDTAWCLGWIMIYNSKTLEFWKFCFWKVFERNFLENKGKSYCSWKITNSRIENKKGNFAGKSESTKQFGKNKKLQMQQTMDFFPLDRSTWLFVGRTFSSVYKSLEFVKFEFVDKDFSYVTTRLDCVTVYLHSIGVNWWPINELLRRRNGRQRLVFTRKDVSTDCKWLLDEAHGTRSVLVNILGRYVATTRSTYSRSEIFETVRVLRLRISASTGELLWYSTKLWHFISSMCISVDLVWMNVCTV